MSLHHGTITLFNSIRNDLEKENILLSDALIAEAIRGHIEHAEKERIQTITQRHLQHYFRELLNMLREHGLDLRLPTVFAGGGAELLAERIKQENGLSVVAVLDSFANAEGYKLLLG